MIVLDGGILCVDVWRGGAITQRIFHLVSTNLKGT